LQAKILLTPLEVSKKRIQNNLKHSTNKQHRNHISSRAQRQANNIINVLQDIYKEDGVSGLFAGWYLAIPEAFVTVLVTHYAFKGVAKLIGGE
jgi:hypothetical protein